MLVFPCDNFHIHYMGTGIYGNNKRNLSYFILMLHLIQKFVFTFNRVIQTKKVGEGQKKKL